MFESEVSFALLLPLSLPLGHLSSRLLRGWSGSDIFLHDASIDATGTVVVLLAASGLEGHRRAPPLYYGVQRICPSRFSLE
jgi:hypothetical protein